MILKDNSTNNSQLTKAEQELIKLKNERDAYKNEVEKAKNTIIQKDFRIETQEMKLQRMTELLMAARQELYGKSSEKSEYLNNLIQGELFNESEVISALDSDSDDEQEKDDNAGKAGNEKIRKPHKKQTLCTLPSDTPIIVNDHTNEVTPPVDKNTGKPMVVVGTYSEYKVTYTRKYVIIKEIFPKFGPEEGYEAEDDEKNTFIELPEEKRILKGCMIQEEMVAEIVVNKYLDFLPLYRQCEMHTRNGVPISRQNMSSWIHKFAEKTRPLMALFRKRLLQCDLINMDETSHLVLMENGKKSETTHCEVIQVGTCDDYRVVVYTFNSSKSAEALAKLLQGFSGALMTDGLSGYRILAAKGLEGTNILKLACFAHARRPFVKIVKANPKSKCRIIVNDIAKLYTIESNLRKDWDDGVFGTSKQAFNNKRIELTAPIFTKIKAWLDVNIKTAIPGSALAKGINYCLNLWEALISYPKEFFANPDDNLAERFCLPFSMGSRNWYFSDTCIGAEDSSVMFTLAQNAKLSNINEKHYLTALLRNLNTKERDPKDIDSYEDLLPWNINLDDIIDTERRILASVPDITRTEPYIIRGGLY